MRLLHLFALLLLCPLVSEANSISESERQIFISTYVDIAVAEMHRTGVPASITLGQAILESSWGMSSIAADANNFFCIKCYNGWEGETYQAKDDEPGLSCFRKYASILQSFMDHSNFLRDNVRYRPLFEHHVTDYRKWATGLQACGYATDPNYGSKLSGIIEEYGLWVYDLAISSTRFDVLSTPVLELEEEETMESPAPVAPPAPAPVISAPETMEIPGYRRETIPQQPTPQVPAQSTQDTQPRTGKIRPIVPLPSLDLERR